MQVIGSLDETDRNTLTIYCDNEECYGHYEPFDATKDMFGKIAEKLTVDGKRIKDGE